MSTLVYFTVAFILVIVVELCFLLLWRRRGLAACIMLGALVSGILWTIISWTFSYIGTLSDVDAMREPPLAIADYFVYGFFFVVWVLISSGIALVPAGLTAFIYRRFRSEL
jgi:uncharacterized BrkB/YihY/UPF0761 family membrane protein